jgi:serine protease Do
MPVSVAPAPVLDSARAIGLSAEFRGAAQRALPAVVQIRVTSLHDRRGGWSARRRFEDRSVGTGSGFVIDEDGHVVTNHHVVRDAERVVVALADGREYGAAIIGSDPGTDVALLRLENLGSDKLPVARFGDSDALEVGDWVLALGNPLGLKFTVTAGIVSAKGRSLGILTDEHGSPILEAFIQTDAAVNPGNSGGPLVDLLGRVVGINAAIESGTGYFTGAGFAIPINLARRIAFDLLEEGVVHRPRVGITLQDVTAADAEVYGLIDIAGAEVAAIAPGLPADRAGIRMGDVIVAVEGTPVATASDFQLRLAALRPGDTVDLDLIRFGAAIRRSVLLDQFDPGPAVSLPEPDAATGDDLLGFRVEALPAVVAARTGLPRGARVWITAVDPYGPAARTLPSGVAILSVNGQAVHGLDDFQRLTEGLARGRVVSVVVADPRAEKPAPTIYNYRLR